MDTPIFKPARQGEKPSARAHNEIAGHVAALVGGSFHESFRNSTGHHNRPLPSGAVAASLSEARILRSLQREDAIAGLDGRDWYEIELLSEGLAFWSSVSGKTYEAGSLWKRVDDEGVTRVFECKRTHTLPAGAAPPTASPFENSDWMEAEAIKAWIWGYYAEDYPTSPNLLETAPWLQTDDIVHVVIYDDDRFPDRSYWILETVTRIQIGRLAGTTCSLYWFQAVDGVVEKRLASVYRG